MREKIVIIDENEELCKEIKNNFGDNCKYFTDSIDALENLIQYPVDVVICDILLSKMDGYELIEKIRKYVKPQPKILVYTSISQDKFVEKAMSLGISNYLLKPLSFESIQKRVLECLLEDRSIDTAGLTKSLKMKRLDEKIGYIFMNVGIPAHIKGYHYLREAIMIAVEDPDVINALTKVLYPQVARTFQTAPARVARAIQHAIEISWDHREQNTLHQFFGYTVNKREDKPSVAEFLAVIVDNIQRTMRTP